MEHNESSLVPHLHAFVANQATFDGKNCDLGAQINCITRVYPDRDAFDTNKKAIWNLQ